MARKYSCTRSRSNKRRNTRRHRGGRGGVGGLGVGSYGSRSTLPAADPLSTIGGKRGTPAIHSPLHNKKTRKNRKLRKH